MGIKFVRDSRKNSDGTYDIIHRETSASVVWTKDGISVEEALENAKESAALLRGPFIITESCTFDLATLGLSVGDPINVVCVGGGAGGGGAYVEGAEGAAAGSDAEATGGNGYGAGGGGAKGTTTSGDSTYTSYGGGGGSGYVTKKSIIIQESTVVSVTIGAGGKGGAYRSSGTNGGETRFGSYLSAAGGSGGAGSTARDNKAAGGAGGNPGGTYGVTYTGSILGLFPTGSTVSAPIGGNGYDFTGAFMISGGTHKISGSGCVMIWY